MKNSGKYALYDQTATETAVEITNGDFYNCEWRFEQLANKQFVIHAEGVDGKVLTLSNDGSVSLQTKGTGNLPPVSQRWTVYWQTVNNTPKLFIKDNSNMYYLYSATTAVKLDIYLTQDPSDCGWEITESLQGVYTFENAYYSGYYMGIYEGNNYNALADDNAANPVLVSNPSANFDQGAFRVTYESSLNKYRLMPICSCNGYYRTLSYNSSSADVGLFIIGGGRGYDNLFFDIVQNGNQFVFVTMIGSSNYALSTNSSLEIILSSYNPSTIYNNQKWNFDNYEKSGELYTDLEIYYTSLDFGRLTDSSVPLIVSSDFGKRTYGASPTHYGVDLSMSLENVYCPFSGKVVTSGYTPSTGLRIIIETNAYAYDGTSKIYIEFMHMDSLESFYNNQVSAGNKVGVSGHVGTNSSGYHLHYQVYIDEPNLSSFPDKNDNSINPFWFFMPDAYKVMPNNTYCDPDVYTAENYYEI